jgi:hypothetical protein
MSSDKLPIMTLRGPKRSIRKPLNGAAMPNSKRFMLTADAISVRLQPNSASSGWISTDGEERTPALVNVVKKHNDITNQP